METMQMSFKGWIDKEIVIYTLDGILFSFFVLFCFEKGNPTICDNIDGPGRHYAKWNLRVTGQMLRDSSYISHPR